MSDELKVENERLRGENERLRELLLRCKDELGNVDPLSDSHERRVDALYAELTELPMYMYNRDMTNNKQENKMTKKLNYEPTDLPKYWQFVQQYSKMHCEVIIAGVYHDVWWNTEKSIWEIKGIDF